MSGYLYQLRLGSYVGQVVRIDGPWDVWGRVVALRDNGFHLIRGTGDSKSVDGPSKLYFAVRK